MKDKIKGLNGFQGLRLWHKLALIAILMGATIPCVTFLLIQEKNVAISFGQKEIYGAQYLPALRPLAEQIPQHRGLAQMLLKGNAGAKGQLEMVAQKINENFRALEQMDRQESPEGVTYGVLFGTAGKVAALKRNWDELRSRTSGMKAQDNFDQHSRLMGELRDLIATVADASNLILDPDLDTYYLMDAVVSQLPQAMEGVGQMGGLLAGAAQSGSLSSDEQAQLNFQMASAKDAIKNLRRGMEVAFTYNPELRAQQNRAMEDALKDAEAFLTRAQNLTRAGKVEGNGDQIMTDATKVIDRGFALYDVSLTNLNALLQKRIDGFNQSKYFVLGSVLFGALLTICVVALIARGVARQLSALTRLIGELDKGNLDERAAVLSGDELGALAQSFNQTLDSTRTLMQSRDERDRIQQSIMRLLDEVSGVAEGDLTREAKVTEEVTGAIADSFNFMITELRRIIGKVQDVTIQVTSAAGETRQTTEHLAQGAQEQSARIIRTTHALDQMSVSIQKVSDNAILSAAVAQQSLANSQQGNQAVQNTIKGMSRIREQVQETAKRLKRLGESSQEIGEIVQLIDDIADRTSVLALNASIQAAMAGEAGQGFAVVAEEIERLAERSSEATARIGNLVKAIQMGTNEAISAMEDSTREVVEGSKLALQAGQALNEIENVSTKLADLINSISQASTEQTSSSRALSQEMLDISQITQQTTDGIRKSSVTASSLAELASELRSSVASFKLPDAGSRPKTKTARL
jgi:twitching motility protein PilJ